MGRRLNATAGSLPTTNALEGELIAFATEDDIIIDPVKPNDESQRTFRSQCPDLLTLPEPVHGLEWKDPFYADDGNVIAAFDIDYPRLDASLKEEQATRVNIWTRFFLGLATIGMFGLTSMLDVGFAVFVALATGLFCFVVLYPW